MHNYRISVRQPLIFRDGKPFGTEDNALAESWPFPQPSTIAGAMRTAWADAKSKDYTNEADIESIKARTVCGPLLVRTESSGKSELLFPAPDDSVCLKTEKEGSRIYRLAPEAIGNEKQEGTDLEAGKLCPVFLQKAPKSKPDGNAPRFWHYDRMLEWLKDDRSNALAAKEQGIPHLPVEIRTHVSIEKNTRTAKAGHLFQTAGLDFGRQRKQGAGQSWGWGENEFGLACAFDEKIPDTLRTIGSESRLGFIHEEQALIPDCPNELAKAFNADGIKGFRLILATPAIFDHGYLPEWIDEETLMGSYRGMKLRLHAVSIQRWQAGTSWDMASEGSRQGRGMRGVQRLVPAGSVYWFERLPGSEIMQADGFWLTSISDQRASDGYGLTLPGIWTVPNSIKEQQS